MILENVADYFAELGDHTVNGVQVIVDFPDADLEFAGETLIDESITMAFQTSALVIETGNTVVLKEIGTGFEVTCRVKAVRKTMDGKVSEAQLLRVS